MVERIDQILAESAANWAEISANAAARDAGEAYDAEHRITSK